MSLLYRALLGIFLLSLHPLAGAVLPGQPRLIASEGPDSRAAWVAYENGDVLRCDAVTTTCRAMRGLPRFSRPVAMAAEQGHAAAWIGWSDGQIFHCQADGSCRAVATDRDTGSLRPRPLQPDN